MNEREQTNEELTFYNKWLDIKTLPLIEEAEFVGLESEYVYVRLSNVLIMTIFGGGAITIFIFLSSLTLFIKLILLGSFILLMALWALLIVLEFRIRGYAIRNHDVAYRSGYLFRQRQYLPFRRVQHCKITEGLIERLFNFSTVVVSAAGDDIVSHCLRPDEAQYSQQYINAEGEAPTIETHYGNR